MTPNKLSADTDPTKTFESHADYVDFFIPLICEFDEVGCVCFLSYTYLLRRGASGAAESASNGKQGPDGEFVE